MEQTGGIPFQQIIIYVVLLATLFLVFLGLKKLWKGLKERKKWARTATLILGIIFFILIIIAIVAYNYLLEMGTNFSH